MTTKVQVTVDLYSPDDAKVLALAAELIGLLSDAVSGDLVADTMRQRILNKIGNDIAQLDNNRLAVTNILDALHHGMLSKSK